jgi:hypothetical protein
VMRVCNEYGCGLSSVDDGHVGWVLTFFFTSCNVLVLFEVGVTDGDQNDGKVGFDA